MKAFQNLGYTAEWFVFAGFVLFMWFRLFRRDAETARDAALGLLPDPDEPARTTSRNRTTSPPRTRTPPQRSCDPPVLVDLGHFGTEFLQRPRGPESSGGTSHSTPPAGGRNCTQGPSAPITLPTRSVRMSTAYAPGGGISQFMDTQCPYPVTLGSDHAGTGSGVPMPDAVSGEPQEVQIHPAGTLGGGVV